MEKKLFGNKGVVIHLTDRKYRDDPLAIIAEHLEASQNNPQGLVYLSCGTSFEDLSDVDYLLLYCGDGGNGHHFFAARVQDKSVSSSDLFIPADAATYSAEKWANVPERTWFLLSDLRLFVSPESLTQITVTDREINFLDRIKIKERLSSCYANGALFL